MRRLSRRQRKFARLAALVALAVVGGYLSRSFREWMQPHRGDPFPPEISGLARVIDGDSLWVGSHEVRLKGLDAPEGRQTCTRNGAIWLCGDAARDALRGLIGRGRVSCTVSERDRYARLLASCRVENLNLNAAMVTAGMAVAYGGYEREEAAAKAARRGIWGSEFEAPRRWREENNAN
jgi:endonuclease YncB( thermonuclease family)